MTAAGVVMSRIKRMGNGSGQRQKTDLTDSHRADRVIHAVKTNCTVRELHVHLCRILKRYYNYYGFAGNAETLNNLPIRLGVCVTSGSTGEVSGRVSAWVEFLIAQAALACSEFAFVQCKRKYGRKVTATRTNPSPPAPRVNHE